MINENDARPGDSEGRRWRWRPLVITLVEVAVAVTIGLVFGDWSAAAGIFVGTIRNLGDEEPLSYRWQLCDQSRNRERVGRSDRRSCRMGSAIWHRDKRIRRQR